MASPELPPSTTVAPKTFARKASGMVRSASPLDVFGFNMLNGLLGPVTILLLSLIPAFYPGANLVVSCIAGLVVSVPLCLVYAKLSAIMPRSGGDYVYNSRNLSPAIGFAANLGLTLAVVFLMAVGGVYFAQYGLGPLFQVAGYYYSNQALVNAGNWTVSSLGEFVLGFGVAIAFGALFIFAGMRVFWRIQIVLIALATLSLVIMTIWAIFVSKQTAFANIAATLGNLGGKSLAPLAVGKQPDFSLSMSFKSLIWPIYAIQGCIYSAYIGGEVKQPARTQMSGMVGSMLWLTAWCIIMSVAMIHVFGQPFFANLTMADPAKYGLASTPGYPTLVALSFGNGPAAIIMLALFAVWGLTLTAVETVVASRCVFAWSIDRIAPAWLSKVSARWHSPYTAIIAIIIVGTVFNALFSWKWLTLLGANYGFYIAYFGVAFAAIFLPYKYPSLWSSSPGANRVLGLPTLVWWGILWMPVGALQLWYDFTDEIANIGPVNNFGQFIVFPAIVVGGIVFYYIVRAIQRTRKIDLDLNFREVPPE